MFKLNKINILILSILSICIVTIFPKISSANSLKTFIKRNEGLVLKPYRDPGKKNLAIGYGHNLNAGITVEMAECLLELDIQLAQRFLRKIFSKFDDFSRNKQIALTDMVYCMGPNSFRTFKKMIKAVKNQNWNRAALEIKHSKWYKNYTTRALRDMNLLISN